MTVIQEWDQSCVLGRKRLNPINRWLIPLIFCLTTRNASPWSGIFFTTRKQHLYMYGILFSVNFADDVFTCRNVASVHACSLCHPQRSRFLWSADQLVQNQDLPCLYYYIVADTPTGRRTSWNGRLVCLSAWVARANRQQRRKSCVSR